VCPEHFELLLPFVLADLAFRLGVFQGVFQNAYLLLQLRSYLLHLLTPFLSFDLGTGQLGLQTFGQAMGLFVLLG